MTQGGEIEYGLLRGRVGITEASLWLQKDGSGIDVSNLWRCARDDVAEDLRAGHLRPDDFGKSLPQFEVLDDSHSPGRLQFVNGAANQRRRLEPAQPKDPLCEIGALAGIEATLAQAVDHFSFQHKLRLHVWDIAFGVLDRKRKILMQALDVLVLERAVIARFIPIVHLQAMNTPSTTMTSSTVTAVQSCLRKFAVRRRRIMVCSP